MPPRTLPCISIYSERNILVLEDVYPVGVAGGGGVTFVLNQSICSRRHFRRVVVLVAANRSGVGPAGGLDWRWERGGISPVWQGSTNGARCTGLSTYIAKASLRDEGGVQMVEIVAAVGIKLSRS